MGCYIGTERESGQSFIPGHRDGNDIYREDMYRIRFEVEIMSPTLTPTPNESWIDGVCVIRPNYWE